MTIWFKDIIRPMCCITKYTISDRFGNFHTFCNKNLIRIEKLCT